MTDYVFFYGTLLPRHAPPELAEALLSLKRIGRGSAPGTLYDFGQYPGARFDADAKSSVRGEVFELSSKRTVLKLLDRYEGYDPQNYSRSLFVRRRLPVRVAGKGIVRCWAYEYNKTPKAAPVIAKGEYSQARA